MSPRLSRIDIESAGSDPLKLARALLEQLPGLTGTVPIEAIARALDIVSIEVQPLIGLEGCLQTDRLKSYGQIVVNAKSSARRRRYTVAHELGHFLNEGHRPTSTFGFLCSDEDLSYPHGDDPAVRQEREANVFAIEVLTPRPALRTYLSEPAELEHALAMSEAFQISREAAIRRYVALQGERLAVVFSKDDRVRYVEKSDRFPVTTVWTGDRLTGMLPHRRSADPLTSLDPADAELWLKRPVGLELFAQTLYQDGGYAATMLVAEGGREID